MYQGVVAGKSNGDEEKCLEDQLADAKVAVGRAETELKQLQTKISLTADKELKGKTKQLLSKQEEAVDVEKEQRMWKMSEGLWNLSHLTKRRWRLHLSAFHTKQYIQ
ncbi:Structural maintenance of chromosomes protein 2-1 [Orobanche minor]